MTGRGSTTRDGGNGDGAGTPPHHPSRRARRWCCIPGCTRTPHYACAVSAAHEDGGDGTRLNGQSLYCKSHKGPCCARMGDGGWDGSDRNGSDGGNGKDGDVREGAAAEDDGVAAAADSAASPPCWTGGGPPSSHSAITITMPIDVARIADMARTAIARLYDERDFPDMRAMYALRTISELCGPVFGDVIMCVCGHPFSAHLLGHGRCTVCGADSPCKALRWPGMNLDESQARLWEIAAEKRVEAAEAAERRE